MGLLTKLRRDNSSDDKAGLRERVERLENELHAEEYREKYLSQLNNLDVSDKRGRRAFLAGLAAAGVISLSTSPVAAQTSAPGASCTWLGDQQAAGYGLHGLGSLEGGVTSDTEITNLVGSGLSIVDGELQVTGGSGATASFDYIDFNPIDSPSRTEGRAWYDSDFHVFSYYNDIADTVLQPDEQVNIRVFNGTGGTITKGTVVMISGNQASLPTVTPAQADSVSTVRNLAVTLHDIGNNEEGIAVQIGIIRDLDTSAFNAGEAVWLSASSAGEFTATKPSDPNLPVRVGTVLESKMSGELQVHIVPEWSHQVGTPSSPAPAVYTDQLNITDSLSNNDFFGVLSAGPVASRNFSTSNQSYQTDATWHNFRLVWDDIIPTNATGAFYAVLNTSASLDARLRNVQDGETVLEETGTTAVSSLVNYTPTTTGSVVSLRWQIKSPDGSSVEALDPNVVVGYRL